MTTARPIQAALTSAATFAVGALLPAVMLVTGVSVASRLFLAVLGAVGARAGGANVLKATMRVTFWGALAMALTAGSGQSSVSWRYNTALSDQWSRDEVLPCRVPALGHLGT